MKRLIYLAIFVPVLFTNCSKDKTNAKAETDIPNVQIEVAQSQEIDQIYTFSSTVDAKVKNFITSAGGTRIEKIWVEVGDRVVAGQKLVTMENTMLATGQAQLDNLNIELQRIKALYQSGGVSKQQLDQIQTQYDVAKRNIDNLKDNIVLTSPISGVITMRNFDNGDVSGAQPILQVMQINPVKLKINVSESFYTKIKMGMAVKATSDMYESEEFDGKISLIYPTIDPLTRTFTCEVNVPNANSKLKPGMYGKVELNLGKANKVLVSDKAIIKQSGTNDKYVYLEKDGAVKYHKVELGRRLNDRYEIISGVNEGDNVVINGQSHLLDGKKVKVVK
ncbi:MAG: efflux RND transporter periplasmic adaptor subunit [Bacteroidales bacterium]|jgi:RND family efflux transporter MFP subunit|nr:efflux RND transporter periplasmic adaptor subunit [Bacteroidales bacterium]